MVIRISKNNRKTKIIGEGLDKIHPSTIIVGFPGAGLIGSIGARHIAHELDLKVQGFIRSPLLPTNVTFFDGILAYPYRIYGDPESDLAICVGESPLKDIAHYYIASAILNWADQKSSTDIIILDGFTSDGVEVSDSESVYVIAEPDLWEKTQKMETIKRSISLEEIDLISGFISGVAGALLNESIIRKIDGYAFLSACLDPKVPNPAGAAACIESINELKGLDIDLSGLLFHANRFKQKYGDLARQTSEIQHFKKEGKNFKLYR